MEVLSGEEEGRLAFMGAAAGWAHTRDAGAAAGAGQGAGCSQVLLLDLGGRSTELVLGE